MQNVIAYRNKIVYSTPTISTPQYTANDQVGGLQTISLPTGVTFSSVAVTGLHVVDSAKQSAALNLYFFNSAPTLNSVDNAAMNVTSPEMVSKLAFFMTIASASYVTSAGVTVGSSGENNSPHYLVPSSLSAFYVLAQTTGTPTYNSTSALTFIYQLQLHY